MCEFISFLVSVKHNRLVCGNPYSHNYAPVHSAIDDWREAEWLEYGLSIRTTKDDDLGAYMATVLAIRKTRSELCEYLSPSKDSWGALYYFNEHGFHRAGGKPAVIGANGDIEYWENNKRHRAGGLPAIIWPGDYEMYWEHDKLHRTGGQPAVIKANGAKEYWENGKFIK